MLRQDQKWIYGVAAGFAFFAALALGGRMVYSYNALARLDQTAQARWAQVGHSYRRRLEVTARMTAIAAQAVDFDQSVVHDVIAAHDQVSQVDAAVRSAPASGDAAAAERFATAQSGLSAALTRLGATAARDPGLNNLPAFRTTAADLQAVEAHIQKDWDAFNIAVGEFNQQLDRFPSVLVSGLFRDHRFAAKPLLKHPAEPKAGLNANAS